MDPSNNSQKTDIHLLSYPFQNPQNDIFYSLINGLCEMTIESWLSVLNICDHETEYHSNRVADISVKFARSIMIPEEMVTHIRRGSQLHDIGKLGISEDILKKPGKLTAQDWVEMKKHPVYALKILSPIQYLSEALEIPYHHHEKWDGSGYPDGLRGEDIPLAARIVAIIDTWDALLSNRPYRPAWKKEEAVEFIKNKSGYYFDPDLSKSFIEMIA